MNFDQFPLICFKEDEANAQAQKESYLNKDWFLYVFFNTSGQYVVDIISVPHSDEQLIQTWHNGEAQIERRNLKQG